MGNVPIADVRQQGIGGNRAQYLGFLAGFAGLDNLLSNDKTRSVLGWEPTHAGRVEDVQTGHYID